MVLTDKNDFTGIFLLILTYEQKNFTSRYEFRYFVTNNVYKQVNKTNFDFFKGLLYYLWLEYKKNNVRDF